MTKLKYSIQVTQTTTGNSVWSSGKVASDALNCLYGSISSCMSKKEKKRQDHINNTIENKEQSWENRPDTEKKE
jgi:hypothetical protein